MERLRHGEKQLAQDHAAFCVAKYLWVPLTSLPLRHPRPCRLHPGYVCLHLATYLEFPTPWVFTSSWSDPLLLRFHWHSTQGFNFSVLTLRLLAALWPLVASFLLLIIHFCKTSYSCVSGRKEGDTPTCVAICAWAKGWAVSSHWQTWQEVLWLIMMSVCYSHSGLWTEELVVRFEACTSCSYSYYAAVTEFEPCCGTLCFLFCSLEYNCFTMVCFCWTMKWISYMDTYMPSFMSLPPTPTRPSHPSRSSQSARLSSLGCPSAPH